MDLIWQKFTEWLKELLISGIMDNVNGLFDNVNSRVAGIAGQVGATPQGWNSGVYGMIRGLRDCPQTKPPQESSHEPSESRSTRRLQEPSVRINERSPPRTASPFSGCTPTACAA